MMRRKAVAFSLRALAVALFIALPAAVISTKFPLWREQGGSGVAIGSGSLLLIAIVFITFKKYITAFAAEKLGALSAGVSLVFLWGAMTLMCILLAEIETIINDLITVFLWSAIGAAAGLTCLIIARCMEREPKQQKEADDGESD